MSKATTTMLDAALSYAKAGLPVIPLHSVLEDGSCTCGVARCHSPGKHPRTKNGLKDATTDPAVIEKWWSQRRWPNASIGGVGGAFLCLDVDAKNGGLNTLERLVKANTKLPDTAVVETGEYDGTRGLHYWYRVPDGVNAATRANVRQGIDIRCTGGYAVLPPSPHHSGVTYQWLAGGIEDATDCPEWILDLVPEYVAEDSSWAPDPAFRMSKPVKQFLKGELEVDIGEQREFLVAAARSVLTTGRSVELTASLLWEGYDGTGGISNCEWRDGEPWTPEDIYALVSDIYAKPPTSPLEKDFSDQEFSLDDIGNAERLIASFKEDHVQYVPETDQWLIWDQNDERYKIESASYLHRRQAQIMEELSNQAMNVRSEGEAKALYSWAKTSRMQARIEAAAKMARIFREVHEYHLDASPHIFAAQNGLIDLRNGDLIESQPSDLITKCSAAEYDPDAESDIFLDFLDQAVPDKDLQAFLQLACGYSLTGSIDEHKFFYLYGRPATGKSTFLDTFTKVMGSYARVSDTSTFTRAHGNNAPTEDLARLAGARLVVTHEVEENERFASALVAQYTGGDGVAARFLYGRTFEFHPRFKLWIAANHRARVSGARSGIWRRMMVIPMDEVVPKGDRDPTLPRKLREPEALSAMLAWAVRGAVRWHALNKKGKEMAPPLVVEQEGENYQRESDHLFAFLEESVEVTGEETDRVPKDELYELYQAWCDKEGREHRVTSNKLSMSLKDMDLSYKNMHYEGRTRSCWYGLKVKTSGIRIKGARSE